MPDLLSTPPAQTLLKTLGAPTPAPLRRYSPDEPLLPAPALLGGPKGGRLLQPGIYDCRRVGATNTFELITPGWPGSFETPAGGAQ